MLLVELLKQYRDAKRTADLMRVLTTYVGATGETTDEAAQLAYYSLLSETNVPRAHVVAKSTFAGEADDPLRRLVYVFSLWKQKRAAEAIITLNELKPGVNSDIVPAALVRAAIFADLGQMDEARTSLALFKAETALPEEVALAAKVTAQLKKPGEAAKTGAP